MELLVSGVAITFHPLGTYPFNGLVHAVRSATIQAHRGDRGIIRVLVLYSFGDPVHPIDGVFLWHGPVAINDKKEEKTAYMSEVQPLPSLP